MTRHLEAVSDDVDSAGGEVLRCQGLTKSFGDHTVVDNLSFSIRLRTLSEVRAAVADDGVIDLTLDDSYTVLPRILAEANDTGARVLSFEVKEPDLEEVFLQLTGRALRN